jgi:hypothetical protein
LFSAVVLAFSDAPLASLAADTLPRELAAAMVLDAGSVHALNREVPRSSRKVRLIVASCGVGDLDRSPNMSRVG